MRVFKFVSLAVLAFVSAASAEDEVLRPMTLQECVRLAVENNFDVQIRRLDPEIAQFNLAGAYAYYVPELQGSLTHESNTREGGLNTFTGQPFPSTTSESESLRVGVGGVTPWGLVYDLTPSISHRTGSSGGGFDFHEGQTGITLSQPLLRDFLIDAGRQNILIAKKDIQISEAQLVEQIMLTVNEVEQAYYDLLQAREEIKVQEKGLELARTLLDQNRRRVEVGTMAPLEEKQAESEAALRRADLITARGQYDVAQNTLKNLISDKYVNWHRVNVDPVEKLIVVPERFDVADSWRRGLTQRPDLRRLRLDLERRDINLRYLRNQVYPAIDLVGSYGHNGLDRRASGVFQDQARGTSPFYSAGVVFSVPLSTRGPRNAYKASKAEKEQAILLAKQQEQQILVQIDNALKTAQSNLERIEATRTARQYAEAALSAEQKKLEAGKSTSFIVLELQRDLTEARSREIRALADYNKALAELAFSEGETLQRHKVTVK